MISVIKNWLLNLRSLKSRKAMMTNQLLTIVMIGIAVLVVTIVVIHFFHSSSEGTNSLFDFAKSLFGVRN